MNSWQGKRCRYEFGANYWLELFSLEGLVKAATGARIDVTCPVVANVANTEYSETTKETIISY